MQIHIALEIIFKVRGKLKYWEKLGKNLSQQTINKLNYTHGVTYEALCKISLRLPVSKIFIKC